MTVHPQAEGPSCQVFSVRNRNSSAPDPFSAFVFSRLPSCSPSPPHLGDPPRLARASGDLPGAVAPAWGTSTGTEPITSRLRRRRRRFGRRPWRTTSRSSRPSSPPATASSSPVPTCRLPSKLAKPNSSPQGSELRCRDSHVAAGARSG